MSIKDKAERYLVSGSVDLRVVHIRKGLHKENPFLLMLGDVVAKAGENGLIESLGLAVCWWIIRCCCRMFSTKEESHRSKEFVDKFGYHYQ